MRGRFDGAPVTLFGATATPFERDGRFFFSLPAVGGEGPREAEVALCVGSRRYQQYFERVDGPSGPVYRRLPLLWHIGDARWMHLNGVFLEPDDDDWSRHQAVWNVNCVFCHNTGVAPGLKPVGDGGEKRFDTHVADVGIACESCHGPARAHVALYASPLARYRAELARGGRGARHRRSAARRPGAKARRCAGSATRSGCPTRWRSCGRSSTPGRPSGRAACWPAT